MTDARARLHAMFNLSETDEAELNTRIDAVVAEETATLRTRVAELEGAQAEKARRRRPGACDACGDIPDEWCPSCASCRNGCYGGHEGNACTHPNAPWKATP